MAETRRFPRWLTVVAAMFFVIAGFWIWLNFAFRAPEVIPVLKQSPTNSDRNGTAPEFALLTSVPEQGIGTLAQSARANTASTSIAIDCSSPALASEQMNEWIDDSFGAELTEFVLSGATSWAEQHPATIRESWSEHDGLEAPVSYAAYDDSMLKAAADNGDTLAAAIYGATLVTTAQKEMFKLDADTLRARMAIAEHYLQQGIGAGVTGSLQFFWRSAEVQATRSRIHKSEGFTKQYANRSAVIETHARLLLNQLHGSFEERTAAHLALALPDQLPPLHDDIERSAVLERARSLEGKLQMADITRSKEERRAENAVVALLTAGVRQKNAFDNMRCIDGRPLEEVLPDDAFEKLANRYGVPQ